MAFVDTVLLTDHYFFKKLNSQLTNPVFDLIFPAITDLHQNTILMMYVLPVFLVLWLVWHRLKCAKTLLGIVIAVAASDAICYHVIKKNIQRDRPEKVMTDVILRSPSHSGWSFPSNHASNVFAAAFVVRYMYPNMRSFVYIAAMLIAYSRIYVGVHFPLDVFGGAVLGYLCGFFTIFFGNFFQRPNWKNEVPDFAKN
jgi:undecaprenyl-diphosphatase